MEAVHIRGDLVSYKAIWIMKWNCRFWCVGIVSGSKSKLRSGQPPCCLRKRYTKKKGWEIKPEKLRAEMRSTFFFFSFLFSFPFYCQWWQPTERKCSQCLSLRGCAGENHSRRQRPQTLGNGLLPVNNPLKWCGLYWAGSQLKPNSFVLTSPLSLQWAVFNRGHSLLL